MEIAKPTQDLNQTKQKIIDLHDNIQNENIKEIEGIIQTFGDNQDQHAYNDAGQSAMAASLEVFNLDIYELLITNGFRLGALEDIKRIVKGEYKQKQIFEIHRKCATESEKEHLTVLRSKCKLHFNTPEHKKEECFRAIMATLEELDETADEISTLLKILALCPELKIIFDFDKTSTDAIDPREDKYTSGSCYYRIFCITIGAKNLLDNEKSSELLGTMAHEFCHLAMFLMFNNRCKPYKQSDESTKNKFAKIVSDYKKRFDRKEIGEKIVQLVYECYGVNVWQAELIVRVPHLLAHYKGDEGKLKQLRNNFNELFEFYENLMPKTKQNMIEMKVQFAVKEINEICGFSSELQTTKFNLKDDAIDKFIIDLESKNLQTFKSNCVEFTIRTIHEKAKKLEKSKFLIFAKLDNFKNEKISNQIFTALESFENVSVIVNCDKLDQNKRKIINEIHEKIRKNQKIVFLSNEKLKIAAIECKEVKHLWTELTEESQKQMLEIEAIFQGSKVKLNEIFSENPILVDFIPFEELVKEKKIKIGEEIKFDEIHVERKFVAADAEWNKWWKKYDKEPIAVDEIIEEIENSKVFFLSDAPGNGKSTEFKFLTFKLKENFKNRWILLIDLKKHTKNFENDSENSTNFDSIQKITNFLAEKILKLKNFEKKFLSELFKNDHVVVLMDGVDEISPSFKNFVMNLASGIRKTTKNQLWVATRPHLAKELEEILETKAWELTKFNKEDQMSFFEKIFTKHDLKFDEFREKIEKFLGKLEKDRNWRESNKVSNPLLLRMIAELFIDDQNFELQNSSLYKIYDKFVTKMFKRLLTKGSEAEEDSVEFMGDMKIKDYHRKIAVERKFDKMLHWIKFGHFFQNLPEPSDDQLARIGLMHKYGDGRFFFIHETFKEFFAAQTIYEKIFKVAFVSKDELREVIQILWKTLFNDDCNVIMKFLDDALENFKLDQNCEKSKILMDSMKNEPFNMTYAAEYGYNNLLIVLSELIADKEKVMKLWLAFWGSGLNSLMRAFRFQTFEKIKKLWSFVEKFFNEDEIKILLTFKHENYPFYRNCFKSALLNEDERTFTFILELEEKILKNCEKGKFIDYRSFNELEIFVEYGGSKVVLVLNRYKKFLAPQYKDFLRYLGEKYLTKAFGYEGVESIKFFCNAFKDNHGSDEFKAILRKTNERGENVLMVGAAHGPDPEVFETLIGFIENENDVREMLQQENNEGRNALMYACRWGKYFETIEKVLEAYEKYFETKKLNQMLVKEDEEKKNVLDRAAGRNFDLFNLVWNSMQKLFDNELLKTMLMKSLQYIKCYKLYKFMPFILQNLSVDEYPEIFPHWFEVFEEFGEYNCKKLLDSVDAQDEFANLFFTKFFEFRDENSETIFDCAMQNEYYSKEVLEMLKEKRNKIFNATYIEQLEKLKSCGKVEVDEFSRTKISQLRKELEAKNWYHPEVLELLISFIENDNEVREILLQEDLFGRNALMNACEYGIKEIGKILKTYEKYFVSKEELQEIFAREDKEMKNVLDITACRVFYYFEVIWNFMHKLSDNELLKTMLMKSLKYIKSYKLHEFMPLILRNLSVDEYPLIFPQCFKAVKEFNEYGCRKLLDSVDDQEKCANLFFTKLFEFRDENNKTIIDCANQNEYHSKKVIEVFKEKSNKIFKAKFMEQLEKWNSSGKVEVDELSRTQISQLRKELEARNWNHPEVFELLINFIEDDNEVREILLQNDFFGRNTLMNACEYGIEEIGKILETYEKYFVNKEELQEIFAREDKKMKNVLDIAAGRNFDYFEAVWNFIQKHFDDELSKTMLMKSLKYIKCYWLHEFMPIILRNLSVDEYPAIFPQWFEAAKELRKYGCWELLNSLNAQIKCANWFYTKLFEFQDENNKTIFDFAKQNEYYSKEVLGMLKKKKKSIRKFHIMMQVMRRFFNC